MKFNPTPVFIALLASTITSLLLALLLWLFELDKASILSITALIFMVSSALYYVLLQYFIQRKIQRIYKNIYRFKSRDKKLLKQIGTPNADPIDDVSKEVLSWMQDNKKEVLELREQAKYRRDFIGNVSHELKTPVFSIQGYIHTLLDGALEDAEVNRKFLKKAAKGVDRLAALVEELTSISEIQAGKLQLKMERFDLLELVSEVFEWVESLAETHKVELKVEKAGVRNSFATGDRKRIGQVLTNLLVNAIKYGREGNEVVVRLSSIDKNLLIEVIDKGQGIDEEHIMRLFDRFYRVDEHRNREEGGSGLGLAIVKHIVEAHGHSVNVQSVKGEGSVFSFTLTKA